MPKMKLIMILIMSVLTGAVLPFDLKPKNLQMDIYGGPLHCRALGCENITSDDGSLEKVVNVTTFEGVVPAICKPCMTKYAQYLPKLELGKAGLIKLQSKSDAISAYKKSNRE